MSKSGITSFLCASKESKSKSFKALRFCSGYKSQVEVCPKDRLIKEVHYVMMDLEAWRVGMSQHTKARQQGRDKVTCEQVARA